MADSRPASRLLHHRISIARAIPRTNAMNLLAFYQLPESRWATRKLAEPQKLESDLESAYKSKMAVWGIIFMSSVLGMVLGMWSWSWRCWYGGAVGVTPTVSPPWFTLSRPRE
ncbi:unnamed protein product, partial [Ectocarpus sp. 6 AP-2014]